MSTLLCLNFGNVGRRNILESNRLMQVPGSIGNFVAIRDLVLVHDEKQPRLLWRMGKVEDLIKGEDNIVRGAVVRVQSGGGITILRRPVQKQYPLELNLNTKATRSEDDDVQHSKQDESLEILVNV